MKARSPLRSIGSVLALSFFAVISAVHGGFPDDPSVVWRKTGGPIGGLGYNVRYVPEDPSIMFVTDGWAGVQRSNNGGESWQAMNEGIDARSRPSQDAIPVFALRIDPNNSDIIWAGLLSGKGLFRSTDGGLTYLPRSNGLPLGETFTIRHIEVAPGDSNKVFVMGEHDTGFWGEGFARTRGFVFASSDGGANWSPLGSSSFPFPSLTRWLWIDPSNHNIMVVTTGIFDREADTEEVGFASGRGVGVYRTTDGGATWTHSNVGMDSDSSLFVGGFDKHPSIAGTMIVATGNNTDWLIKSVPGAVYRSTDGGGSWTNLTPPPAFPGEFENFTAVAYAPSDGNIVYTASSAAVYRSENGGTTWTRHSGIDDSPWGPPGIRSGVPIDMVVAPTDPNTLYINNYGGGVFRSQDGGASWEVWSEGYTGADINQLAVRPGDRATVLAIGRSGCFLSESSGSIWSGLAYCYGAIPEGNAVTFDPGDSGGNTYLMGDEGDGTILRTVNGGLEWSPVLELPGVGPGNRHGVRSIVFAPSATAVVYAGFCVPGLHADPHNLDFDSSFGVYKSTDGGVNWIEANGDLPNPLKGRNVTALAVSHQDANVVYLGLREGGIFKTSNGGVNWTHVTNQPANGWDDVWPSGEPIRRDSILSLAIHPDDDDIVYAGTNARGLYRTVDGGGSWSQLVHEDDLIDQATENHVHVFSVILNPQDPDEIYLGEWHGGIYRSTDGGATWSRINTGLSTRAVQTLAISTDGSTVYAGTKGEGVFRNRLDSQMINFPDFGDTPFTAGTSLALTASTSSGLPVSFASSNPAVATVTVTGTEITFHTPGSVEIIASQPGNSEFAPAAPRSRMAVVTMPVVTKQAQTITFSPPKPPRFKANKSFKLKAVSSSGLPVTFASSSKRVLAIKRTKATMRRKGKAKITASQAGDASYLPAPSVSANVKIK
jgi:photosystem II stability/assembly factor-like uncharacterized protein